MHNFSVGEVFHNILEKILRIDQEIVRGQMSISAKNDILVMRVIESVIQAAIDAGSQIRKGLTKRSLTIWTGWQFEPIDDEQLRDFLTEAATKAGIPEEEASISILRDKLVRQLRDYRFDLVSNVNDTTRFEKEIIGFKNAYVIIDASGQVMVESPTPELMPTATILSEYDETAASPMFDKFIEMAVPNPDTRKALFEYLACVLIPFGHLMEPNLQKCAMIVGPRDSGKSVLVHLLEALLGGQQAIRRNLSALTNPDTFKLSALENVLLCVCNDTDNRIRNKEIFKSLVSGEGAEADVKYSQEIQLNHYAKFLIVGNSFPQMISKDPAFYKRILPIPFFESVSSDQQDPRLAQKIIESELPGIANHIVSGMCRLLHNGSYTISDEMSMTLRAYELEAFHVEEFLGSEGYHIVTKGGTELNALYQGYLSFCQGLQYSDILTSKLFSIALKNLGYQCYTPRGIKAFHISNNTEHEKKK